MRWAGLIARLVVTLALAFTTHVGTAAAQVRRVQGVVRDEAGHPIKGATVVAENPDAVPSTFTVTTDGRGQWGILGIRPGLWTFTVSAAGFRSQSGTGRIEALGGQTPIEFKLVRVPSGPTGVLAGRELADLEADIGAADSLMEARRYDEATAAYRAILAKTPALTSLNLRIGQAQRLQRRFDEAIDTFAGIPADDALAREARREIGLTYLEKGDVDRADEVLTGEAAAKGAGREAYDALGDVKLAKGEVDEAARWYRRAADADPSWARPPLKLGLMAANRGDGAAAGQYLRQVIALAPDSPEATQARTILDQLKR